MVQLLMCKCCCATAEKISRIYAYEISVSIDSCSNNKSSFQQLAHVLPNLEYVKWHCLLCLKAIKYTEQEFTEVFKTEQCMILLILFFRAK